MGKLPFISHLVVDVVGRTGGVCCQCWLVEAQLCHVGELQLVGLIHDTQTCHVTSLLERLEVPCSFLRSFQLTQSLGPGLKSVEEAEV